MEPTIIQSVLSAIPIYRMSLCKIPTKVGILFERKMWDFLWERMGGKHHYLVVWRKAGKIELLQQSGYGVSLRKETVLGLRLFKAFTGFRTVVGKLREEKECPIEILGSFYHRYDFFLS